MNILKQEFPRFHESLIKAQLENGLEIHIIPKPRFHKTYALFLTKYGSMDNTFIHKDLKEVSMPYGIAHFLEHKLFEMEDGTDAGSTLDALGAQPNAYTSYNKTAYLFSATKNVDQCLEVLLDFVQTPYFTKEGVDKEQGIIDEELKMYQDMPQEALRQGLLKNMYHANEVKEDIGGTISSIKEIDQEKLYLCHETFYHPSNMILVVVGNVDPDQVIQLVQNNQAKKQFAESKLEARVRKVEKQEIVQKTKTISMDIVDAKVAIGVKLHVQDWNPKTYIKEELSFRILLEELFGLTSSRYQEMLDLELINQTFGYDIMYEDFSQFIYLHSDTKKPEAFVAYIENVFGSLNEFTLDESSILRYLKVIHGGYIRGLNFVEYIANTYAQYQIHGLNMFEVLELIEEVTLEDVKKAKDTIQLEGFSSFIIESTKK